MYEMSGDFFSRCLSSSTIPTTRSLGVLLCIFLPSLVVLGCARFRASKKKSPQTGATDEAKQQKTKPDTTITAPAPAKLTSDAPPHTARSPPSNRPKKKREAKTTGGEGKLSREPEEDKPKTPIVEKTERVSAQRTVDKTNEGPGSSAEFFRNPRRRTVGTTTTQTKGDSERHKKRRRRHRGGTTDDYYTDEPSADEVRSHDTTGDKLTFDEIGNEDDSKAAHRSPPPAMQQSPSAVADGAVSAGGYENLEGILGDTPKSDAAAPSPVDVPPPAAKHAKRKTQRKQHQKTEEISQQQPSAGATSPMLLPAPPQPASSITANNNEAERGEELHNFMDAAEKVVDAAEKAREHGNNNAAAEAANIARASSPHRLAKKKKKVSAKKLSDDL